MQSGNVRRGTILSYLLVLVHVAVNFVYAPLLLGTLGDTEYGLYQSVGAFFAYISILETSMSAGVLKFYCQALAREDEPGMENVLATARRIYRVLSLIVLAAGIGFVFAFRAFYASTLTMGEINEGMVMLSLLFVNMVITLSNAIYVTDLTAREHFTFLRGLTIVVQVLQPLACCLLLLRLPYALTVVLVQLVMNALAALLRYGYDKRRLHVKVALHGWDKSLARQLLALSASLLLASIADQIFWKTDQLILGKMYSMAAVTVYAIGSQIYMNYTYAGTTVSAIFFPRASRVYAQENGLESLSRLFTKVGRIAFQLCLMVLSGFLIFGRQFITVWVGESYLQAYWVALIVMVPFTVDVSQNLGLSILQIMNLYSFRAKMYFAAAVMNIGLTVWMASLWGGIGAAASTAITMALTSGVIMNVYYQKKAGLDMRLFWQNLLSILARLLPLIAAAYLVNFFLLPGGGLLSLLGKIAVYSLLYALYSYLFVFNREEKTLVKGLLARVRRLIVR